MNGSVVEKDRRRIRPVVTDPKQMARPIQGHCGSNSTATRRPAWWPALLETLASRASGGSSGARRAVQPSRLTLRQVELISGEMLRKAGILNGQIADREPARLIFDRDFHRHRRGGERRSLRATQTATRRVRSRCFERLTRVRVIRPMSGHRRTARLQVIAAGRRRGGRPRQLQRQKQGDCNQFSSERFQTAGQHRNFSGEFCRTALGSAAAFCPRIVGVAIADFSESPNSVPTKLLAGSPEHR